MGTFLKRFDIGSKFPLTTMYSYNIVGCRLGRAIRIAIPKVELALPAGLKNPLI